MSRPASAIAATTFGEGPKLFSLAPILARNGLPRTRSCASGPTNGTVAGSERTSGVSDGRSVMVGSRVYPAGRELLKHRMGKWNRFSKRSDPKTGRYVGRADLGQRAPSAKNAPRALRQSRPRHQDEKNPAVARRVFLTVRLMS